MATAWESHFPNIGQWEKTSEPTGTYNCIAFAAADDSAWWDPFPPNLYYWPRGVRRSYELSAFIEAYETQGFKPCQDGSLEAGFEKIVIYVNPGGGVEHAARQLPDGRWTSKMGREEDIAHKSPDSLTGGDYGKPSQYMKRAIAAEKNDIAEEQSVPAQPHGAENLRHREDFTSLLNAAAQKQKPDDQT